MGCRISTALQHSMAIERVVVHMRAHLGDPLDLDALSYVAAMSKYHFVRVFEEVTGTTPHSFLASIRIAKAKRLLLTTTHDVTDICFTVGYTSLGSFSTAFSSLVGMSPSSFRQRVDLPADQLVATVLSFHQRKTPTDGGTVKGIVRAPRHECGIVFVGAFVRGIPQGRPLCGTVLLGPGPFQLSSPGLTQFHLLAALMPYSLIGAIKREQLPIEMVASARIVSTSKELPALELRKLRLTDPPIVLDLSAVFSFAGL
jgi:AraC family transcriptional regulator